MFIVGVIIRGWGVISNPSFSLLITKPNELITSGAYKYVRHPGYLGSLFMAAGIGVMFAGINATILPVIVLYSLLTHRADLEEELLSKEFPEYVRYQETVGKFFPKVFRR